MGMLLLRGKKNKNKTKLEKDTQSLRLFLVLDVWGLISKKIGLKLGELLQYKSQFENTWKSFILQASSTNGTGHSLAVI